MCVCFLFTFLVSLRIIFKLLWLQEKHLWPMKLGFPPIPSKALLSPFWRNTQQEGTHLPALWFGAQRMWKMHKTEYLLLWDLHLLEETDCEQIKKQGTCRLWWMPGKKERTENESKHKGLRQGSGVASLRTGKSLGKSIPEALAQSQGQTCV